MSRPGRRAFIGTLGAAAVALPEFATTAPGVGDARAAVKQGLRVVYAERCRRLEFDALLLALGLAIARGGREALAAFAKGAR